MGWSNQKGEEVIRNEKGYSDREGVTRTRRGKSGQRGKSRRRRKMNTEETE